MKVLMLCWELPPFYTGGLGVACQGIANELSKVCDLTVVVPLSEINTNSLYKVIGLNNLKESSTSYKQWLTKKDVNPYHSECLTEEEFKLDKTEGSIFNKGGVYDHLQIKINAFTHLVNEIEFDDFDIIYAHDWVTFLAGIQLKKKTAKPLVTHIHSLEYDRSGGDVKSEGVSFQIEKYAMEFSDYVITVSNYTASVCRFRYGIDKNKIQVIHNGIDFKPSFQKKRKTKNPREVLFLGRLTEQKGVSSFLKISKILSSLKPDVRITIAGSGEELQGLLEERDKMGLSNVRFTGHVSAAEVQKLFLKTDVYCMPSASEPFGLSALEAVCNGVPIVISKQSGVGEVLSGAIEVDYWNVNKIAKNIKELLTNDVYYESKLSLLSINIQNLSWKKSVNKTILTFNNIINHE